MEKIIIIEDNPNVFEKLTFHLEKAKFKIFRVEKGEKALEVIEKESPSIVLIDVLLPKLDGNFIFNAIRHTSNVPIIFISYKNGIEDIIDGLNLGADDYITKPFDPVLVVARIQSILRRITIEKKTNGTRQPLKDAQIDITSTNRYEFNDILVDPIHYTITIHGKTEKLSAKELAILSHFIRHTNQVFTPEQLYKEIWNTPSVGDTRTIAVHIRNLRKKIEKNPKEPHFIKNVRGQGYIFTGFL